MIRAQRFRLTRICGALRVGLVPPAAIAFVEALKTPVDLVLDANIGIHVFVSQPPCALVTEQGPQMGICLTHI